MFFFFIFSNHSLLLILNIQTTHTTNTNTKMDQGQTRARAETPDEGVMKIELKQLPFYGGCMIIFLQIVNPNLLNELVITYFTNMVYIIFMVAGVAYIQGQQYFQELFNIHKNDVPDESQQPEGTEMMNLFDGHIRVVLLMKKNTVIREVHREVLLLGNGFLEVNDEQQPRERRRQGEGGVRGGGNRNATRQATATQNTHNQLDTQVHLRLIVSVVEPDTGHWSYWFSRFGYETRKKERTLWNHTVTL